MYTLEKKANFTLHFGPGNQCGGHPGSSEFAYEFVVSTPYLDDRGFVIEHVEASAAIEDWAESGLFSGTCENVVQGLLAIIVDHTRQLKSGRVTVKVTRNGNATIGWSGWFSTLRSFQFGVSEHMKPRFVRTKRKAKR